MTLRSTVAALGLALTAAGAASAEDWPARAVDMMLGDTPELDLMRAELDLLKRAVRRLAQPG